MSSQTQSEQFTVAIAGVFIGDRALSGAWLGRDVPLPGLEDWFLLDGTWDIDGSWADVAPWPLVRVLFNMRDVSGEWIGRNVLEGWFLITGVWDTDGVWVDGASWQTTPVPFSVRDINVIWRRVNVN